MCINDIIRCPTNEQYLFQFLLFICEEEKNVNFKIRMIKIYRFNLKIDLGKY